MPILAGTGKGVYALAENTDPRPVLDCRGVRELVRINKRIFAGTGAGLFCSTDDGETWSAAAMADHEIWQVRATSDGILYAGTQPAGLFRSDDNGETWHEIDSFRSAPGADRWCIPVDPPVAARARALVINQDNARQMLVGVEVGGIMNTDDGGHTWTLSLPGNNPDLHMLCAHPEEADTLFASTGYGRLDGVAEMIEGNAGVFRSNDGGATWQYAWAGITPRYSRPMCIDHRAPYGLTVASAPTAFSHYRDDGGAKAMLFRSTDQGNSWRSLCDQAHSPARENFHGLTVDPTEPGSVFVGTDTGEVWRVSDDACWQLIGTGMPIVLSVAAWR